MENIWVPSLSRLYSITRARLILKNNYKILSRKDILMMLWAWTSYSIIPWLEPSQSASLAFELNKVQCVNLRYYMVQFIFPVFPCVPLLCSGQTSQIALLVDLQYSLDLLLHGFVYTVSSLCKYAASFCYLAQFYIFKSVMSTVSYLSRQMQCF